MSSTRDRRTIALALPAGVAAALVIALAAGLGCGRPGERETGGCPPGETCSTMRGLAFDTGRPLFSGYGALAVGGTEYIRVLELAADGSAPPLDSPGTARHFDANADASILTVVHGTSPEVDVTGVAPGVARLRILEPGTNTLIDSLPIRVEAVAAERLWTTASRIVRPSQDVQDVYAGSTATFQYALVAADGTNLWDASVDRSHLRQEVPATGTIAVDVTRAAGSSHFTLAVVSSVDDIAIVAATIEGLFGAPDASADATAGVDLHTNPADPNTEPYALCAVGMLGLAVVAGVPLHVTVDDPGVVALSIADPSATLDAECVPLSPGPSASTVGMFETDVHFGGPGVSRAVHVRVHVDPTSGASPLLSEPTPPTAQLGERASAIAP